MLLRLECLALSRNVASFTGISECSLSCGPIRVSGPVAPIRIQRLFLTFVYGVFNPYYRFASLKHLTTNKPLELPFAGFFDALRCLQPTLEHLALAGFTPLLGEPSNESVGEPVYLP